MSQFVNFNLNDTIKFKPSDAAKDIYRRDQVELNKLISKPYPEVTEPLKVDADGYAKMQMWVFMKTFGEYFTWGSGNPVENMNVMIEVKSEVYPNVG